MLIVLLLASPIFGQYSQQSTNGRDYQDVSSTNGLGYNQAGWLTNGKNYVRTIYPLGTIFRESFGNVPNGDPCGSPSSQTCQQTWNLASGTAGSIGAMTGCASGANGSALSLGTAAAKVNTYGTFPPLFIDQNYTITITFCPSTYGTSFDELLALTNSGSADHLAEVYWYTSGKLCAIGCGSGTSAATVKNALNTLVISLNSTPSSSYISLNGGTHLAFTPTVTDGQNVFEINADGTAAFNIQSITIVAGTGNTSTGGWQPSMFVDLAGASGGATATQAILNAGTHCGDQQAVSTSSWATPATNYFTIQTGAPSLPVPLPVCGTLYGGNTGLWLQYQNAGVTSGNPFVYFFNTTYSTAIAGFVGNFTVSSLTNLTTSDVFRLQGAGFLICGQTTLGYTGSTCAGSSSANTQLILCGENNAGTNAGCLPITSGSSYFVQMFTQSSNADTLTVYNWPGLSLVGTVAITGNWSGGSGTMNVGPFGSENPTNTVTWKYSNIILVNADAPSSLLAYY